MSEQDGLPPAYEKKGETLVAVNPMTKGYRLPTDAEWEWVARYAGGGKLRRYPWGDALPVAPRSGNYADATARLIVQDVIPDYDDGFAAAAPVGKFPPNPLGLYDIGGNVAEWVHDYYTVSVDSSQALVDPLGPAEGKQHVIRGASWKQSGVTDLRLSARDFGDGSAQRRGLPRRALRRVRTRGATMKPMRMLVLLAVFWAAGSLLLAAESPTASAPKPAAATPKPAAATAADRAAKAGDAAGDAKADGEGESKGKGSIAEQAEAALKAAAEADVGGSADDAAKSDGESGKGAAQDDTQAPPSRGSAKGPSPQRFVPSEQVRADFDVSFPIDI